MLIILILLLIVVYYCQVFSEKYTVSDYFVYFSSKISIYYTTHPCATLKPDLKQRCHYVRIAAWILYRQTCYQQRLIEKDLAHLLCLLGIIHSGSVERQER